jgi:hypothetical protein
MSSIDGYVIVTAAGKLKKPRRSAPSIFLRRSVAQNACRNEGDSVLQVSINLDQEPVFIRGHKL